MTFLRSVAFLVLFNGTTAILSIGFLMVIALTRKSSFPPFARWWVRMSLGMAQFATGISLQVRGRERLPEGPVIFAAKHQSALETLAFNLIVEDVAFILKKELLRIPLFGLYLQRMDNIAVDRSAGAKALVHMVEQSREVLSRGRDILIFPQGTRTAPGDDQSPYLPGVAGLYSKAGVTVVPVALNTGLFWGKNSFLKHPGEAVIEFLDPIEPGLDRKTFMKTLKERIEPASKALEAEARQRYPYLDQG